MTNNIRIRAQLRSGDARFVAEALPSSARLDRLIADARQEVADEAEIIFAAHAPKKTRRLARGIRARALGSSVEVTVEARDKGFDYVRITRFGHRVARIEPRADRASASVRATRRARGTVSGGNAALAFVPKGGSAMIFRRSVKGYHPTSDWATDALPDVRRAAARVMRRVGAKIERGI